MKRLVEGEDSQIQQTKRQRKERPEGHYVLDNIPNEVWSVILQHTTRRDVRT